MIIGITGGIGSGKTTLLQEFVNFGAVGYISDIKAKVLMNTHPELIQSIQLLFGSDAYDEHQQLDRTFISHQIFKDKKLLSAMNNLVRPFIYEDFQNFCKLHANKVRVYESAILLESDFRNLFDLTITINAATNIRIDRVQKRNGWSIEKIKNIIHSQFTDLQRSELANKVIDGNDLDKAKVEIGKIYASIAL